VKTILMLAMLALPMAGCSTVKVSTKELPGAAQTIAGYTTYAWLPPRSRDEMHGHPFVEAHLKQAVDGDLAAKEYRRVERSENPDFMIGWHVTTAASTSAEAINPYWGYTWGPPFGPPSGYGGGLAPPGTHAPYYEQGTLVLDIVDARSNKLLWRGAARADLGAGVMGSDTHKKVHKAVDKILAEFPPKG
jgi:hypothetical protein